MADVDDYKALGLRALAAGFPRRRWEGPVFCAPDAEWRDDRGVLWRGGNGPYDRWPDFRDDATIGVLRGQVREQWERPGLTTRHMLGEHWTVWEDGPGARRPLLCLFPELLYGPFPVKEPTEAAALVAALEAAP